MFKEKNNMEKTVQKRKQLWDFSAYFLFSTAWSLLNLRNCGIKPAQTTMSQETGCLDSSQCKRVASLSTDLFNEHFYCTQQRFTIWSGKCFFSPISLKKKIRIMLLWLCSEAICSLPKKRLNPDEEHDTPTVGSRALTCPYQKADCCHESSTSQPKYRIFILLLAELLSHMHAVLNLPLL